MKPVTHGPGLHVGDTFLAQTIDRDSVVSKDPKIIEGYRLETVRTADSKQVLAVGDDLNACACNRIDISDLPFAAEKYEISPDINGFVLVETPIIVATFPNRNMDAFGLNDLLDFRELIGVPTYRSWRGKPVHVDHQNSNCADAVGIILDATMAKFRGKWHVRLLKGICREKAPEMAKAVQERNVVGHSMGALVERAICSIPSCQYESDGVTTCEHIAQGAGKGRIINGVLCYERLVDSNGVESSLITSNDQASPTALTDFIL